MPDFNPGEVRRMLELRKFPMFAEIDLHELATLAENVFETVFPAGTLIAREGARLSAIHLILEGHVQMGTHTSGPRNIFGALEVLAERAAPAPVVALTDTRTLRLSASDLNELLEDNFGILLSLLRALAGRMLDVQPVSQRSAIKVAHTGRLGFVERLVLLRQQLPFTRARLHALATLARVADEVSWPAGTIVSKIGEPAVALVITEGTLRAGSRQLGAGDPIGYLETIAGRSHTVTAEALTTVRALRSSGPDLVDVLEDHTDLGLTMIGTFADALLMPAVVDPPLAN